MDSKSNIPLSFDPEAWELSVVAHRPRNWQPITSRQGIRRQSARAARAPFLPTPRRAPVRRSTALRSVLHQVPQLSSPEHRRQA